MSLVLDASMTIAWLFDDEATPTWSWRCVFNGPWLRVTPRWSRRRNGGASMS
jgi:hypothetical protein